MRKSRKGGCVSSESEPNLITSHWSGALAKVSRTDVCIRTCTRNRCAVPLVFIYGIRSFTVIVINRILTDQMHELLGCELRRAELASLRKEDVPATWAVQSSKRVRSLKEVSAVLRPSLEKELARELISAGIEGLLFPSVVGGDDNLMSTVSIVVEGRFPSRTNGRSSIR
jgi:hypothetical protein